MLEPSRPGDLGSLVYPVAPAAFFADHWEQRPLVAAGGGSNRFDALFSLSDVDRLLSAGVIHPAAVGLVREGTPIPVGSLSTEGSAGDGSTLEAVYSEFRAGATIVLYAVHDKHRPLAELCRKLSQEFSASFQVNAYLTPADSQGLRTHYDTHDVFVLQLEGSKHWRLFDAPVPLPLKDQPFKRGLTEVGAPQQEFDLEAGDLMYLPRGFLHDASTGGSTSLHLTVGVKPVTWASVILGAVESCIEKQPRLRSSLPPGFAEDPRPSQLEAELRDLLALVQTTVDVGAAVNDAVATALKGQGVSSAGRLLDLEAEDDIDADTLLKRRPDVRWSVERADGRVALRSNAKCVRVPEFAEPELRLMADADEFTVGSLPGNLSEDGALVLVRRLVREGLLTICR